MLKPKPATKLSDTQVLPHLNQSNWLEFEQSTAESLFENLSDELDRISHSPTSKRVHDTRVALRRWDSIWVVLERDGWRTKAYWKNVGKPLRRLRKALGELRDWDVNLETGEAVGLPKAILTEWSAERDFNRKKMRKELKKIDMDALLKQFARFIRKRPRELRQEIEETYPEQLLQTAFDHLEPFLQEQEVLTTQIERIATTPETMHQLRLAIKAWRYLLTEFYGLTNL
ncbi:MAG: CHAD domain-containing protein [Terriglobales bacterium]